jgi:sterol desaturase/sphingolipid hydroxylase (fatty acid hydroxylase superfamily)
MDFSLYIRHRFVHHFFWNYHTVHHSTREITWITWLKLHPLDMVVMGLIDVVVMFFLGFGGEAIAIASLIKFHFNRFCHSNIALDYGFPLRYVFCSPNMHRWHHAADDPEAVNKNFCIVFAWIDLLFGTFYVPKDRLPEHYGVWDAEHHDVVGTGFWEMMAYPFVQDWRGLKKLIGRKPQGDPEPASGEGAAAPESGS